MGIRVLCAGKTDQLFEAVKTAVNGIECEVAKSSSVALALFLALKNYPCLILSERALVEGTGEELYLALQQEEQLEQIPFFIVTAGDTDRSGAPDSATGWPRPSDPASSREESGAPACKAIERLPVWIRQYLVEIPDRRPEETPE